jgi:hypothetical protein
MFSSLWELPLPACPPGDFLDFFLVVPGPDVETRRIDCVQEANLAGNVEEDAVLARVPVPVNTIRH